jgi:hypothetical protein
MLRISIVRGDVLDHECDLLSLKHADGFHGADETVAGRIGFADDVVAKSFALTPGTKIKARQVLFIGVGPLSDFRYAEIRAFGRRAIKLAGELLEDPQKIAMTIHGPGYGLDEKEAFLSLLGGILDAVHSKERPAGLRQLDIVESDQRRVVRLRRLLAQTFKIESAPIVKRGSVSVFPRGDNRSVLTQVLATPFDDEEGATTYGEASKLKLANYGQASERKLRLFVAMPFKEEWSDEYDIAIVEATQETNILCERIDHQAFVGDVMSQVHARIASYQGMLALLNDANPNVCLEVGYAWGKGKPTILIAKKGQALPFDISGQKCIVYKNIADLRSKLKTELKALVENGTLRHR